MKNGEVTQLDVSDVFPDVIQPTMHVHPQHEKSVLSFKTSEHQSSGEITMLVDVEKFYGLLEQMRAAQRA